MIPMTASSSSSLSLRADDVSQDVEVDAILQTDEG